MFIVIPVGAGMMKSVDWHSLLANHNLRSPASAICGVGTEVRMMTMQQQAARFGIYYNAAQNQVVRINSPYWFPPEPEWQMVTREVNATLLDIRGLVREQGLSADADSVAWTTIPLLDEDA